MSTYLHVLHRKTQIFISSHDLLEVPKKVRECGEGEWVDKLEKSFYLILHIPFSIDEQIQRLANLILESSSFASAPY